MAEVRRLKCSKYALMKRHFLAHIDSLAKCHGYDIWREKRHTKYKCFFHTHELGSIYQGLEKENLPQGSWSLS